MRIMSNYILITSKAALFLLLPCLISAQQLVDKVIAKVGSEYVLLSDLEGDYQYRLSLDPTMDESSKCGIVEEIIAQKIIVYHAKLDSVDVSDDEVEARLNYRFDAVLAQMNGDEEFFKEVYGATISEMKDRYRQDQREQILAERMQVNILNEVSITPMEVKGYYNSIPYDSIPYLNAEVELSEIVVKPEVNSVERQKALDKILEIRDRILTKGEDFGELAKKYSMDFGSGQKGGELGFAKRGSYVQEFEATVFTMNKNEVSDVVETEFGFHIIELLERRGNTVRARHILIKPEITEDDERLAREKLDSVRTLILADSITFEFAVKKYGFSEMPSYSNNGRVKNPKTGNNFFEASDVDPDTYFAIDELDVGGITGPLELIMPTRERYYRIVKLESLIKPHRANLEQDYDKITIAAKENKKAEYFAEWVEGKIDETFIEIDPILSGCPNLEEFGIQSPGRL